jgi:excisionase family DNA binding protein
MPANGQSRDTLSTGDATKLLRVCRQTVIKWADDGDIPFWRTSGGRQRFSAAELCTSGYVPVEKPRLDPTVEAWPQTRAGDDRRRRQLLHERGRAKGPDHPSGPSPARSTHPAGLIKATCRAFPLASRRARRTLGQADTKVCAG